MKKKMNLPVSGVFARLSPTARRWIAIAVAVIVAMLGAVVKETQRPPAGTDAAATGTIAGNYRGIDGDSFRVAGNEVRLLGVDAPEGRQLCRRDGRDWECGREAASRLTAKIADRDVRCEIEKIDQHGRKLGVCGVGGVELNRWLVENGWAVAYGGYEAEERIARQSRRGIWASEFERPRDWRDHNLGGD